jgi:hypothetical protein
MGIIVTEPMQSLLLLADLIADPSAGNDALRDAAIDVLNDFDVEIPYEEYEGDYDGE